MINADYILEPEVQNDIPAQTNYSFERQLFPGLLAAASRSMPILQQPTGLISHGQYFQLHPGPFKRQSQWVWIKAGSTGSVGNCSSDGLSAGTVELVLIGADCNIGSTVKIIVPVVMGPGTYVEYGLIIHESILWQNVKIETGVNLNNCLVANDSVFETGSSAEKSIVGDHVTVSRNTKLGPGSRVWPVIK
jgi:mannose-1-phosphate guanylyltransferase/phosphomannomutase